MIPWYEDNSMEITHTVDGSDAGATVTATITDAEGEEVWSDTLAPTGTDDEYSVTVHPADADLQNGARYTLVVVGDYGGAKLTSREVFRPRVRETS
jgi:hypothetical protein